MLGEDTTIRGVPWSKLKADAMKADFEISEKYKLYFQGYDPETA